MPVDSGVPGSGAPLPTLGARRALIMVAAVLGLGLVGWLGWRLVVGPEAADSAESGAAAPGAAAPGLAASDGGGSQGVGEIVPLAPGSGMELRLLGWQHTAGSASAVATVHNIDSRWTEFVVDVAAVDATGTAVYGFATAEVGDLRPGKVGVFTLTIPDGVPEGAELGVANVWGRMPGDPQIHAINFAPTGGSDVGGSDVGGSDVGGSDVGESNGSGSDAATPGKAWTEVELMAVASQFAASLAAMQEGCRTDTTLAGLVCLSRRTFPDFLLAQTTRDMIEGQPYFHQEADPTGPPRAFELTAPGGAQACVGQRIDKQTSDQVAILGTCSQRGLYPGDGRVRSGMPAAPQLPQLPTSARSSTPARASTPVGPGGLPGGPVAADRSAASTGRAPGIGDTVEIGDLGIRIDGVQVGLSDVPGLPARAGAYTLVGVTVTNAGENPVDLSTLALSVGDTAGTPLALVPSGLGATFGWPPQPGVLPSGAQVSTTVALELYAGQTAATATFADRVNAVAVTISLLPPLA